MRQRISCRACSELQYVTAGLSLWRGVWILQRPLHYDRHALRWSFKALYAVACPEWQQRGDTKGGLVVQFTPPLQPMLGQAAVLGPSQAEGSENETHSVA